MSVVSFESNNKGGDELMTAVKTRKPYNNLKGLLVRNEIKQSEMAKMIGMDTSTFNLKINRTNGRDFTLDEAIQISEILNVKVDDFF